MSRILSCCIVLFLSGVPLHAQQAPIIDVRSAVAEFISDDEIPNFSIRGIFVSGKVDTMKAVIKTSTVRALGSEYARYKPVLDKVSWYALDSSLSEVVISMHLEGKVLPLPSDSVRGSVRLTVSAATWSGTDWLGTSSESFVVPIVNAAVPKPIITAHDLKVIRSSAGGPFPSFSINGLRVSIPTSDSIDHVPDVRVLELGDVSVTYDRKSLRTLDRERDAKRDITLISELMTDGTVVLSGSLTGQPLPSAAIGATFSFSVTIKSRLRHRHVPSPFRVRTVQVVVPNVK